MAKAIEDRGHLAEATKPLRLKHYQTGKLPDPGQCVDHIELHAIVSVETKRTG